MKPVAQSLDIGLFCLLIALVLNFSTLIYSVYVCVLMYAHAPIWCQLRLSELMTGVFPYESSFQTQYALALLSQVCVAQVGLKLVANLLLPVCWKLRCDPPLSS